MTEGSSKDVAPSAEPARLEEGAVAVEALSKGVERVAEKAEDEQTSNSDATTGDRTPVAEGSKLSLNEETPAVLEVSSEPEEKKDSLKAEESKVATESKVEGVGDTKSKETSSSEKATSNGTPPEIILNVERIGETFIQNGVAKKEPDLQDVPLTPPDTLVSLKEEKPPGPAANGTVEPPPDTYVSTEKISCVQVLNVMVFFAFMVNYMLRVNLTIAIVDMIAVNETSASNITTIIDEPKFPWNTYEKNLILGCFFWGYILTELPGGRMSEVFGPRRVFGYTILMASIVTFFTPIAALKFDYMGVVVLRVIIGFMLGVTFPAMQPIAAKWIPPKDRTKFVSNMMASSLGAAITLPVCGYLISSFGWQSVFYVTGILGIIWAIFWFLFVFDSPSQHPRITKEEREYLEKSIGISSTVRKAPKVPWLALLTSLPVWAIVITHAASVFGYFTFLNQMPSYMSNVLGTNIKKNGILSSFPYVGKYVMALVTSYIADYIRATGKLSTTAIRKIFTTLAVGLPGFMMVAQVYLGYSTFWTVAIFTVALTLNGAVTAGYLGNGLDIAPNFSGTIFGMANTLSSLGGFVSTYIVADITFQNETYERFQIIFWILAVTYFVGSLVYLLFGTGELQEWNDKGLEKARDVEMIEKQPLKNDTINEKL